MTTSCVDCKFHDMCHSRHLAGALIRSHSVYNNATGLRATAILEQLQATCSVFQPLHACPYCEDRKTIMSYKTINGVPHEVLIPCPHCEVKDE